GGLAVQRALARLSRDRWAPALRNLEPPVLWRRDRAVPWIHGPGARCYRGDDGERVPRSTDPIGPRHRRARTRLLIRHGVARLLADSQRVAAARRPAQRRPVGLARAGC